MMFCGQRMMLKTHFCSQILVFTSSAVAAGWFSLIKPRSQRGCWAFRFSHVRGGEPLLKMVLNTNQNEKDFHLSSPCLPFLVVWGYYHAVNWNHCIENQGRKTLSASLCLGVMMLLPSLHRLDLSWQRDRSLLLWLSADAAFLIRRAVTEMKEGELK